MPSLTYSGQIVRQYEPDLFLLSLFAPASVRLALWALFACHHEIAKTRDVVSETATGLIRLQWWREAVGEIFEGRSPRRNEILPDLARAVHDFGLSRVDFDTMIYTREFDLEGRNPGTLEGLARYAEGIYGSLFRLALSILGETDTSDAINKASVRCGILHAIRCVPKHVGQGWCLLPADILAHHNVSIKKIYDFNDKQDLPRVIEEVLAGLPNNRNAQSWFLRRLHRLTDIYLRQIEKAGYDPYHPSLVLPPPFLALRLAWPFQAA